MLRQILRTKYESDQVRKKSFKTSVASNSKVTSKVFNYCKARGKTLDADVCT